MKLTSGVTAWARRAIRSARPRDLLRQLGILACRFNCYVSPSNRTRRPESNKVGKDTQFRRPRFVAEFLRTLPQFGYRLNYLDDLCAEHVRAVIQKWDQDGLVTKTLQTRLSAIRMLFYWLGIEERLPGNHELLPRRHWHANGYAKSDKSWTGNGLDINEVVTWVPATDMWIRFVIRLAKHFGLRAKEAAFLWPHQADRGNVLVITRGTKGGRGRHVLRDIPIETPEQRKLLDELKQFVPPEQSLMGPVWAITWRQARHRIDEVIGRLLQINRRDIGVTLHGLRVEYALDIYERITGEPAPVRGGHAIAPQIDRKARLEIARRLGHGRINVVAAYIGRVLRVPNPRKRGKKQILPIPVRAADGAST